MKTTETRKGRVLNKIHASSVNIIHTEGYKEAMDDIRKGRVYHVDSVEDMFWQILGYIPK